MDLIIRGGTVVSAGDLSRLDIGIRNGRIVALAPDLQGPNVLDAGGCYVLPGLIDPHVHLDMRLGDIVSADDWRSGTMAAACGGVTTVVDFTENVRGEDLRRAARERRAQAGRGSAVDFGLHLTLADASPATLDALPALAAEGYASAKLYMTYSGLRLTDDEILPILAACRAAGILPMVHAENHDAAAYLTTGLLAAGRTAPHYHPLSRPPLVEAEGAQRVLALACLTETPLYLAHVTCRETLAALAQARARGQQVLAETCPHYLALTAAAYDSPGFEGAKFVCTPPLRPEGNPEALWQALAGDELQIVSTDHCPWSWLDKQRGRDSFALIPNGLPGVETRLALLYGLGVAAGRLSLPRLVEVTAGAPARALGLAPRKGDIAVGADADLVLWDPAGQTALRAATLHQRVDYTPFEGLTLPGRLAATLRRGQVVVRNGQWVGEGMKGEFVARGRSPLVAQSARRETA